MQEHLFEERNYRKPYVQSSNTADTCAKLLPAHLELQQYNGGFPSQSLCNFVNATKKQMLYFDDGLRMQYSKYLY